LPAPAGTDRSGALTGRARWGGEDPVDAAPWPGSATSSRAFAQSPACNRAWATSSHRGARRSLKSPVRITLSSSSHRLDFKSRWRGRGLSTAAGLDSGVCRRGVDGHHRHHHATGPATVPVGEPDDRNPSPMAVEVRDREPASGEPTPAVTAPDDGVLGVTRRVEHRVPGAGQPSERPVLQGLELLQTGDLDVMPLEEPDQPADPRRTGRHARMLPARGGVAGTRVLNVATVNPPPASICARPPPQLECPQPGREVWPARSRGVPQVPRAGFVRIGYTTHLLPPVHASTLRPAARDIRRKKTEYI